MANLNLRKPVIAGLMRYSPSYRSMSFGTTKRVVLLGHADATINVPLQVNNMQEAVNFLGADTSSPLIRALLEAYTAGCRDIWVMAVAPMSEYESVIADRNTANSDWSGLNFYENYKARLEVAYDLLLEQDFPEIVVPVEAVFYDSGSVDFLTQLVSFCSSYFASTGGVVLGILGTRIVDQNADSIAEMVADSRIESYGSDGKYVMVVVGEGLISLPQLNSAFVCPLATQAAAAAATYPLNRGLTYARMSTTINLSGLEYSDSELTALTEAKLNPVIRTSKSRRGNPYRTVLLTDNTMASEGSDFWAFSTMRVVAECIGRIKDLGYKYIGYANSSTYNDFKQSVDDYLKTLVKYGVLKEYSLLIDLIDIVAGRVVVTVGLTPFTTLREIYFTVETGPGA